MNRLKPWGWIPFVGVAALMVGVLTWLVFGSLIEREIAFWGLLFTSILVVLAGLADWFTRKDESGVRGWSRLKSPNWLARLGMSIFFGLGMGLFAQQFIAPTEFDLLREGLGDVRAGVNQLDGKADIIISQTAPKPWRAFENIDGYWGEERGGCRVVYRFERRDHGLIVSLATREPGMSDYGMTATIHEDGEGDVINATLRTSTETDERSGDALLFTYANDGVTERLDWLNETRSNAGALKLEPCGEPQ